ncbi:MAG TPA: putative 2-aminoethylphosphonate ABC transporter ATP-binding protein [Kiloniellaceae bacterium]
MSSYLRIRDLQKNFGDFTALRDVSLDVEEGEFVCFLGPSGCGKTTLLRAIAGLDLQTRGSIEQAGRDISALPIAQRDFGIVFQSYALFPNLTIERNIAFGLENSGRPRAEVTRRVAELLDLVGLDDQRGKYPAQLSGGQQQRIALARAIASSPGLLLLDEPLSALDAKVRVHLRHQIKELQRKLGVTTIMVTHDQEEALSMADRIVVMNHGVIEQIGTPTEIYRAPRSLFVADFIGETNRIHSTLSAPGSFTLGDTSLLGMTDGLAPGQAIVVTIRPEDIIPHAPGSRSAVSGGGLIEVTIGEMEFLGSFWRSRLTGEALGGEELYADFSMNAVRRLSLDEGARLTIELPASRLIAFPAQAESHAG